MKKVSSIIVGGGLAGTTLAVYLHCRGEDFILLESSGRLGGKVETIVTPEALFELGPSSFADQPDDILTLLRLLDLEPEIVLPTPAAANRFILKQGQIVRLPSKPQEILTTKALSFRGRLRFLREFFYVPPSASPDESVYDFFCRHFGREVADYFAAPFVAGITAGDAKKLSIATSFPQMAEAEARSASLIRYLLSFRRTNHMAPRSLQLKKGLTSIFRRAADKIGNEKISLNRPVREIVLEPGFCRVMTDAGEYRAEKLYLTSPAFVSSQHIEKQMPDLAKSLAGINYAPVVVAHLKIPREEKYPFNGFGILIPPAEGSSLLGVLWNSSVFPELFPDQKNHYVTVFAGGACNPTLVGQSDADLSRLIFEEATDLFNLKGEPYLSHLQRHLRAIPQYNIGYGQILRRMAEASAKYPCLKFAGNYVGGTSMPKTVAQAISIVSSP